MRFLRSEIYGRIPIYITQNVVGGYTQANGLRGSKCLLCLSCFSKVTHNAGRDPWCESDFKKLQYVLSGIIKVSYY